jgi:hypothetical protein
VIARAQHRERFRAEERPARTAHGRVDAVRHRGVQQERMREPGELAQWRQRTVGLEQVDEREFDAG